MKTRALESNRSSGASRRWPAEHGFLVIALLIILSILLIYVGANVRLLTNLIREIQLVEKKQTLRLERAGAQPSAITNALLSAAAESAAASPPRQ